MYENLKEENERQENFNESLKHENKSKWLNY